CMTRLVELSVAHAQAKERGGLLGAMRRASCAVQALFTFGRLFLLPVKKQALPAEIRMQPTW
ncbi:MAG: magnesium-protoporphyrin IX monomethyl ester (oxidative) cyclase, partial [Betaproteobacteria bacterium]|nr:magnesium-protoporphyrin IX monomethyl ester (oxidative) cyclase [Betaproteobacteria bacterium]